MYDWEAANQRKKDAVQQLVPLAAELDDLEARIAELLARIKDLDLHRDRIDRFGMHVGAK